MIALTQYMARIFLVEDATWLEAVLDRHQFLITLSTVLIAASGYIINDYFDIKIDLVNKPREVIIGREITRREAILFHQVLNFLGALIGFMVSLKVFIVNVLAITLLWIYASAFKKKAFIGNVVVAGLTGASLVVMAVFYPKNDLLINIYAVFAFGISLIREIVKDIEDIRGDYKYGANTLPIRWGIRKTKVFLFVISFSFVAVVISMGMALGNQRLQWTFLSLGIPFMWFLYLLYKADRKTHFTRLSLLSKLLMFLGILSMITLHN